MNYKLLNNSRDIFWHIVMLVIYPFRLAIFPLMFAISFLNTDWEDKFEREAALDFWRFFYHPWF